MTYVKTSRHLLLFYNAAVTPISKTYVQRGTVQSAAIGRLLLLMHRNRLSRNAHPSHPETSATRSTSCWISSCWPSGWASFWWRWVMRTPANAFEENENDFRLFTRRPRRCRLAVLLYLCPAAASAILAPKEPALDLVSSRRQLFFDVPRPVPALGRWVCLKTFDATE